MLNFSLVKNPIIWYLRIYLPLIPHAVFESFCVAYSMLKRWSCYFS